MTWDPNAKSAKLSGGVVPAVFVVPPVPIPVPAPVPVVPEVHYKRIMLYKRDFFEHVFLKIALAVMLCVFLGWPRPIIPKNVGFVF